MPTPISGLPEASEAKSTDQVPVNQDGVTKRVTIAQMATRIAAALGLGGLAYLASVGSGQITDGSVAPVDMTVGTPGAVLVYGTAGVPVEAGPGTSTYVFTSNGSGAVPTFQPASAGYTDEQAQDAVGVMVGTAGSITYVDGTPALHLADRDFGDFTCGTLGTVCDIDNSAITSAAVSDFTEAVQDAMGAALGDSLTYVDGTPLFHLAAKDYGDFTCTGTSSTCAVNSDAITSAKMRNSIGLSVMGRTGGSTGDPEDIGTTNGSGHLLKELQGSGVGWGLLVNANITTGTIAYSKMVDGGALSVAGRSANSAGVKADISATAGAYGALRERGSALSFRRESYQALTASGTGTVTVTFTVATSPNATIANSVAEAHSLVINAVSPVDGEQGFIVITNASSGEPFDDTPTFQLNGSTTNVSHFGDVMQEGNNDITVYRWLFDGTRLIVWVDANTAPPA